LLRQKSLKVRKKRKASCGIVGVSRKKVSPPSYEI